MDIGSLYALIGECKVKIQMYNSAFVLVDLIVSNLHNAQKQVKSGEDCLKTAFIFNGKIGDSGKLSNMNTSLVGLINTFSGEIPAMMNAEIERLNGVIADCWAQIEAIRAARAAEKAKSGGGSA